MLNLKNMMKKKDDSYMEEDDKLKTIANLMKDLMEDMKPKKDDFMSRLGMPKDEGEVEIMKVEMEPDESGDDEEEMDMLPSDEEDIYENEDEMKKMKLKKRIMNLKKGM